MIKLPRVVRAGSRYAVVFAQSDDSVSLLHTLEGVYDVATLTNVDAFKREWTEIDEFAYAGKVLPTVSHYLEVAVRSTLPLTDAAHNALKEIEAMQTTLIVSKTGDLVAQLSDGGVVINPQQSAKENAATLGAKLGERSLARFVTVALKLAKPLARVKAQDARIENAVATLLAATKTPSTTNAKATRAAATSATKPAAAKKASTRKPGVKHAVHAILSEGKRVTLAQLVKMTGGTDVSIKTALSDLKNPKYGIGGKALNVIKDPNNGEYFVSKSGK
jgi:hypothetical protein